MNEGELVDVIRDVVADIHKWDKAALLDFNMRVAIIETRLTAVLKEIRAEEG